MPTPSPVVPTPTTPIPPPVLPPVPPPAVPTPVPTPAPAPAPVPAPELAPQPDISAPEVDTTPTMAPMMLLYAVAAFAYNIAFKKTAENINAAPDGNGLFMFDTTVSSPRQVAPPSAQAEKDMSTGSNMNKEAMDAAMALEGVSEDQADQIREEMQVTAEDLPD